jgi:hypothetical protein
VKVGWSVNKNVWPTDPERLSYLWLLVEPMSRHVITNNNELSSSR